MMWRPFQRLPCLFCFLSSLVAVSSHGRLPGIVVPLFGRRHRPQCLSSSASTRPARAERNLPWIYAAKGGGKEQQQQFTRDKAISSIQWCYKVALFSSLVDVVAAVRDKAINFAHLSWNDGMHLMELLHTLGIGMGLLRVSKVYKKELKEISASDLYVATRTMSNLWQWSSWVLLFSPMSQWQQMAPGKGPASVIWLAFLSALTVDKSRPPPVTNEELQKVRLQGFRASQWMALCYRVLIMDGVTRCVTTWTKEPFNIFERVLKTGYVAEPFGVAFLLIALYRSFRQVVLNVTSQKPTEESFESLYQAQYGFYSKVSSVILGPALIKLFTPCIVAVKNHLSAALQQWAFSD